MIFDLDGVAVAVVPDHIKILHELDPSVLLYFLRRTALLSASSFQPVPQCVMPGFIELLRFLYSPEIREVVDISFFSSLGLRRSQDIVRAILNRSLGPDQAERELLNTTILSVEYCRRASDLERQLQMPLYGIQNGILMNKKDIFRVVCRDDAENTLLIDDQLGVICLHQERNYCAVPSGSIDVFYDAVSKRRNCESARDPMFQKLNSIFYLAGLLQTCIAHFKTQKAESVTEMLFQLQFERKRPVVPTSILQTYLFRCYELFATQYYYELGLTILQRYTINSKLCFITSDEILSHIKSPPTTAEQQMLSKCFEEPRRPSANFDKVQSGVWMSPRGPKKVGQYSYFGAPKSLPDIGAHRQDADRTPRQFRR